MAEQKVVVKRTFNAPVKKVWDAWTVPSQMQEWLAPQTMTTPEARVDLRVDGEQMIHMKGQKGQDHVSHGTYKTIDPTKLLVFTWQWENDPVVSEVALEFKALSDTQTEVILTHTFPDEESAGDHQQGWESTLNKLETFVAK